MKKEVASNFRVLLVGTLITNILSLVLSYIFKLNLSIIAIVMSVILVYIYAYSRDEIDEKNLKWNFRIFVGCELTAIYALSYMLIYNLIYKPLSRIQMSGELMDVGSSLSGTTNALSLVVNFFITIMFVIYMTDADRREKFMILRDISLSNMFNGESSEEGSGEPDVRIGVDKETGKDVIIPHTDRYTHCICIGPTNDKFLY